MKVAVQLPAKWRPSERCQNKNWREFAGGPSLVARKVMRLLNGAPDDWDIWLDSEAREAFESVCLSREVQAQDRRPLFHLRHPTYAENWANGNHVFQQFVCAHPGYDWYVQVFATAPFLRVKTMVEMVKGLACADLDKVGNGSSFLRQALCVAGNPGYDSALTVHPQRDMLWHNGKPVNHDPRRVDGEVRTQEMNTMRATHGCYVVRGDVARKTGCRVGANPLLWEVNAREAFDVDTEEDFAQAERMVREEREDEAK